ncbi:MAG: OmpG porin family protein [Rhodobacterales bacterium]|nr:OmpG porin family protein [Rhodobacterales bacterium]
MVKQLFRNSAGVVSLAMIIPLSGAAESAFEGSYETGFEAERRKCTTCEPTEYENEIEATILDLVLKPKAHEDLSFGIQLELDTKSDGAILGSGRLDAVNNNGVGVWFRKKFDNGIWARIQGAAESDERLFDLGGRIGYKTRLTDHLEFSGYVNLDRRFRLGSGSDADQGTYLEVNTELEWDDDDYGAWIEFEASKWFFDSASAPDKLEWMVQPGIWFDLGDTDHRGLFWVEAEGASKNSPGPKKEYKIELGVGVEFELPKRSEILVAVTFGKEREERPGRPQEQADVYGLEVSFQRQF